MERRAFVKTLPAMSLLAGATSGAAQEPQPIALPKPEKAGGQSVLAALWDRKTMGNSITSLFQYVPENSLMIWTVAWA